MSSGSTQRAPIDLTRWAREGAKLRALLATRPSVTTMCHEDPDGDTIGAAVAMALAARQLGCDAEIVAGGLPDAYRDLVGELPVRARPELPPGVAIVCDSATLSRVGDVATACSAWLAQATVVAIDHHITNDGFGTLNFVDPAAAATCEIVAEVLPHLGVSLDTRIATALLTGVIRDTNGFSTASTRPATLRMAATAMEAGADLESVYRTTLVAMSAARMKLWGRVLARVRTDLDPRVAVAVMETSDLASTGTEQHDAEGIAEFVQRGTGADIGILLRDLDGTVRVSVRTSAAVDAAEMLRPLGGGGHRRRAGAVIAGSMHDVLPAVLLAARSALA